MSSSTKNFNMDSFKKPEANMNFKMTDFRRDLHNRHKREVHMRKERLRSVDTRYLAKQMITVDTSRARSNCDVLRMCIKELGFKEVLFFGVGYIYTYVMYMMYVYVLKVVLNNLQFYKKIILTLCIR